MSLGEWTTTLPTEEGRYLFIGSRDGRRLLDSDQLRPELVRVGRDGHGRLMYVGTDFFWEPTKAVGRWCRLGLADAIKASSDDLVRAYAVQHAEEFRGSSPERLRAGLGYEWGEHRIRDAVQLERVALAIEEVLRG